MLVEDLLPDAASAAAFIGVSRRRVFQLVASGHIPAVRKGRRLYFRRSELERAFSSTEIAGGAQ